MDSYKDTLFGYIETLRSRVGPFGKYLPESKRRRQALVVMTVVSVLFAVTIAPILKGDADNDGASNFQELKPFQNTGWKTPDTDGDGLKDGWEISRSRFDPTRADTDGDGLNDSEEAERGLNPSRPDTDGDGLNDKRELALPTDPKVADTDGDDLQDGAELQHGTMPTVKDTDGDSLKDGHEVNRLGTNPLKIDTDADNLTDTLEATELRTNPRKRDTDGDGLDDSLEVRQLPTNATLPDTDQDGLHDGTEVNVSAFTATNPDPLRNKSANLSVSEQQRNALARFFGPLVNLMNTAATSDGNKGALWRYSKRVCSLPRIDVTGTGTTALKNFKQAALYQLLDVLSTEFGYELSAAALRGRLRQGIRLGSRFNALLALASDYKRLREQACNLTDGVESNDDGARVGVVIASGVFAIDAYLVVQTGGTFAGSTIYRTAFKGTGVIARKTGLLRLAKYCGWKCVGAVERLLHWSIRTALDVGNSLLLASVIKVGYLDVTDVQLLGLLEGLNVSQLSSLAEMVVGELSLSVYQALVDIIDQLTPDQGGWLPSVSESRVVEPDRSFR